MKSRQRAILALEDGVVFEGWSFGFLGEKTGEVVFNTSMTGYQEILTDPSYKGQIVIMTYPLIGNYGINQEDIESQDPKVEGFVGVLMLTLALLRIVTCTPALPSTRLGTSSGLRVPGVFS